MEAISWNGFDGTAFQVLGNVILYNVVSKRASLYSAPGKDGGIDQYYIGDWDGKSGKWRFQDKFKSVEKGPALSQLRKDIREDIEDHFKGEDFIVYLTPVNLLPQDEQELKDIAAETFADLGIKTPAMVLIWHHAVLEAQIISNPIIYQYFFARREAVLERYKVYFHRQLHAPDLRDCFANRFIGRADTIQDLKNFLDGPQVLAVLTAPGNYGKTRTVLQFFETIIDANEDWLPFVLKPIGFSESSFAQVLMGKRRLVILLDDAHRHMNILAAIKQAAEQHGDRVKVILTARRDFFPAIVGSLPTHSKSLTKIALKPLGPIETREVFRSLVPAHPEENLQWLRAESMGVPGVIVALGYLVQRGIHPADITSDDVFAEFVEKVVAEAIDVAGMSISFEDRKIKEVIRLVALLAPLPPGGASYSIIAEALRCDEDEVDEIIAALKKSGLMVDGDDLAIKPDPVSDTFLRQTYQASAAWVKKHINNPQLNPFFGNMVDNLLEAGIVKVGGEKDMEDLVDRYIGQMRSKTATEASIRNVLHTAMRIAQRMPAVAVRVLESFLTLYADGSHHLHQPSMLAESPMARLKDDAMKLLGRLFRSSGTDSLFPALWVIFLRMVALFKDTHIVYNCFGYNPFDFEGSSLRNGSCCNRQLFLVKMVRPFFTSDDPLEVEIALSAFACLYVPDYHTGDVMDKYTMAIHFVNGRVPDCPHTSEIRREMMDGMIAYYRKHRGDPGLDQKHFSMIVRTVHFQFSFPQNKLHMDEADAFALVFDYVVELLDGDATLTERAMIASTNRSGNHRELKVDYQVQHQRINELLDTGAPTLRLELCLSAQPHNSEVIRQGLTQVALLYPGPAEMVEDLKSLLSSKDDLLTHPLSVLARFLGNNYLEHARNLYDYVIDHAPAYIQPLCGITDYFWDDETIFYGMIDRIWSLDDKWGGKACVVAILASKQRIDHGQLQRKDLDYFEWAITDGPTFSCYQLNYNLYRFAVVDEARTFTLLKKLAVKVLHNAVDDIIYSLVEDEPFCAQFKDQVLDLFRFLAALVDPASNPFRPALHFMHKHFGPNYLFTFLADECSGRNKDEYYTMRNGLYPGDPSFPAQCKLYLSFVKWLPSYPHSLNLRLREELLQFFRPLLPSNEEDIRHFKDFYLELIEKYSHTDQLEDLAVTIRGYSPHDEITLGLLCRLVTRMREVTPSYEAIDELLGTSYLGNTNICRSSVPGHPSIENQKKEYVLTNFLANNTLPDYIQKQLEEALNVVRKEMEMEISPASW